MSPSRFAGALLPTAEDALPFTVAWTLRHFARRQNTGGAEAADNPFRYRYTQVYIYDTVKVDGYDWYQIGVDQWVHQFKVAKILRLISPQLWTLTSGSASTYTNKSPSPTKTKHQYSPR